MIDCIIIAQDSPDKYVVQTCCTDPHYGQPCDCRVHHTAKTYDKALEFAKNLSLKLGVEVKNFL